MNSKIEKLIEEVNKIENVLDLIELVDIPYSFHYFHRLKKENFQQIFNILKENIKNFYIKTSWGWNEKEKIKEMKSKNMKYILIIDPKKPETVVGFCSFQFDLELDPHDEEKQKRKIIYLYELHISKEYQGKGLGSILLNMLEEISKKIKLDFIMLTNLKLNEKSFQFYLKKGFEIDGTSPSKYDIETDYEILSKKVKNLKRKNEEIEIVKKVKIH
jgi:N-alpha-acetyltransferase 40